MIETIPIPDFGITDLSKLNRLDNYIIQDFYESIDDFIQYYTTNSKHSTCPVAWNTISVSCSCRDCQISSNNCVCVKCFLEGPHKHHRCSIHFSDSGNCDCGDHSGWKSSGTCKCHQISSNNTSTENLQNQDNDDYFVSTVEEVPNCSLPPELKQRLLISFKEIKNDIEKMTETGNFQFFEPFCEWYSKFSQLGDEIRNCIIETINDKNFLSQIVLNSKNVDHGKMKAFFHLTATLANNSQFISIFMESVVQVLPELLQTIRRSSTLPFRIYNDVPCVGISIVIHYTYQYINNYSVRILTEQNKFNWIQFILMINDLICDFIISEENRNTFYNFEIVFRIIETYKFVLREIFRMKSERHKMKHFFIEFAKSCQKIEGFCNQQFNDTSQWYDIENYMIRLYKFPHMLSKNIQYFVPEIIDIFIFHLLNDQEFKDRRKNLKNYSMLTLLHQLFINNLLIFDRKSDCEKDAFNNDDVFNVFYKGKDPKETFDFYCQLNMKRKGIEFNEDAINSIYLNAIKLPVASIAAHYLLNFEINELNAPNNINFIIGHYHKTHSFKIFILPRLISIVQTMFSFTSKDYKDKMLSFIANSFEALQSKYDSKSQKIRDFSYLFFICSLILDRNCINEDNISICLKNLMTAMKTAKLDIKQIHSFIAPYDLSNEKFLEKYNKMNIDTDWNLIIPCCSFISNFYTDLIPTIIGKAQDLLLPFPEFDESQNSLLLNLKEIFECKFVFASLFYIIYEYNNDKVMMQYALNLFITFAQNSKYIENDDDLIKQKIHARSIDELADKIPTTNFLLFTKIEVCFKGNTGISLVQLIDDLGPIGFTTLRQAGLSEKAVILSKKKINNMKRGIMKQFNKKRSKFASTIDHQFHNCCSICHQISSPIKNSKNLNHLPYMIQFEIEKSGDYIENKLLYIPIIFYESVSVDLIEDLIHGRFDQNSEKLYEKKTYVRIPLKYNYAHLKCIMNEKFKIKNALLMPKIDSLYEDFGITEKPESIGFVEKNIEASIIHFLAQTNLHQQGIQILARMISVLDHRSRLIPEVLDDSNVFVLYVNLFKNCTFLSNHFEKNVNFESLNSIEKVIFECLRIYSLARYKDSDFEEDKIEFETFLETCENEKINFNQFLFSKIVQKQENSEEFLRRCFLIEKFYLAERGDINDEFIDWESLMNYKNLYSHFYHKKLNDQKIEKLPIFRGLDLPKYFLEFIYPPFNVSFISVTKPFSICLLTGTKYKSNYGQKVNFGMPFTIVLNFFRSEMSSVSILKNQRFTINHRIQTSIYVDKNGFEDPGFARGSNLMLSQEKYNKLIDAFLSGDAIDDSFN